MSNRTQRPILVVDDDEIILQSIDAILSDEDYTVLIATNGKEALEQARLTPPALILLDMKMPVMDGWTFAASYRQQPPPHAPIVVMTAARDTRARAAEIGADEFLAKPFNLDDLLTVVRRFFLAE
ncbi:MAG TPA: response regulator [Ktedonobacterales bacterium]